MKGINTTLLAGALVLAPLWVEAGHNLWLSPSTMAILNEVYIQTLQICEDSSNSDKNCEKTVTNILNEIWLESRESCKTQWQTQIVYDTYSQCTNGEILRLLKEKEESITDKAKEPIKKKI